jgi:hypothetical protein
MQLMRRSTSSTSQTGPGEEKQREVVCFIVFEKEKTN